MHSADVKQSIVIYGAGGHAKVVIDCAINAGSSISGIFDDNQSIKTVMSLPVLGQYDQNKFQDLPIIIAIGENQLRSKLSQQLKHQFYKIQAKSAVVASSAEYKEGTVVLHNSVLQPGVKVGRHVIINTSAVIDHDCEIGDFAHICPNVTLCGGVKVGVGTFIGAGSVIREGISIGKWSVIGAGSVIVNDIPDGVQVFGVPGRIVKKLTV